MDSSTWLNTSLSLSNIHHAMDNQVHQPPPLTSLTTEGDTALMMAEELHRISLENKKLTEMLTDICENYTALETYVKEFMITKHLESSTSELISPNSRSIKKRKSSEIDDQVLGVTSSSTEETSSSNQEPYKVSTKDTNLKISRVHVRTELSDTRLIVKDGYQWRKYGQKVTRDNPSPRAYYKCSFAPTCPVKKKVQKSAENPCLLVATYEGEHNHTHPAQPQSITIDHLGQGPNLITSTCLPALLNYNGHDSSNILALKRSSTSSSPTMSSSPLSDSWKRGSEASDDDDQKATNLHQLLVQQMASSLTKDPIFTNALCAAINAGRSKSLDDVSPHHPPIPKW